MLVLNSLQDRRLASRIIDGGIAVLPTDTVYGIAVRAADQDAVRRLYGLKQRDNKPGTVIASSIDQLVDLGLKRRYLLAVEHFWPGAISVVIPSSGALSYLDQGKGTLAVRVVADQQLKEVLEHAGPLLTSSANLPGKVPANTIEQAKNYFENAVDIYVDGGDLSGREPSTIIRIIDDAIEILRPGAVKIDEKGVIVQ